MIYGTYRHSGQSDTSWIHSNGKNSGCGKPRDHLYTGCRSGNNRKSGKNGNKLSRSARYSDTTLPTTSKAARKTATAAMGTSATDMAGAQAAPGSAGIAPATQHEIAAKTATPANASNSARPRLGCGFDLLSRPIIMQNSGKNGKNGKAMHAGDPPGNVSLTGKGTYVKTGKTGNVRGTGNQSMMASEPASTTAPAMSDRSHLHHGHISGHRFAASPTRHHPA